MRAFTLAAVVSMMGVLLGGCQSAMIAAGEAVGYEKREQLVDRVESARDGQEAAKEQFADALEEFRALTGPVDEDLEEIYDRLSRSLKRSESRAKGVRDRIDNVEVVAKKLFSEWETELDQYESQALRSASEEQLGTTRAQYARLIGAMRKAESTMDPVLRALNDQVLFLKHNLNARAIASLDQELSVLEGDIADLIGEMQDSIDEANAFIEQMRT
ncbi:MAG: DUF2959 family protein [Planctomycetota bacterium]